MKYFFKPDASAREELRDIAPNLHNLRQDLPAEDSPPADYFDSLEDKIWARIAEAPKPKPLFWGFNRWLWQAAAVLLLAATAAWHFGGEAPKPTATTEPSYEQLFAQVDAEEAEAYLLQHADELDFSLLELSADSYDALSDGIYNDDILDEALDDYDI